MSEMRCHCGFGRLEECERFGHERGAKLDHERALRNLDRSQKRVRKFKRAMQHFFPYIDPSEADTALQTIRNDFTDLENRVSTLDREAYTLRKENYALKNPTRPDAAPTASNIPTPVPTPGWLPPTVSNITTPAPTPAWLRPEVVLADPVPACQGCEAPATTTDNAGVPLCAPCFSELEPEHADPAPEDLDGY